MGSDIAETEQRKIYSKLGKQIPRNSMGRTDPELINRPIEAYGHAAEALAGVETGADALLATKMVAQHAPQMVQMLVKMGLPNAAKAVAEEARAVVGRGGQVQGPGARMQQATQGMRPGGLPQAAGMAQRGPAVAPGAPPGASPGAMPNGGMEGLLARLQQSAQQMGSRVMEVLPKAAKQTAKTVKKTPKKTASKAGGEKSALGKRAESIVKRDRQSATRQAEGSNRGEPPRKVRAKPPTKAAGGKNKKMAAPKEPAAQKQVKVQKPQRKLTAGGGKTASGAIRTQGKTVAKQSKSQRMASIKKNSRPAAKAGGRIPKYGRDYTKTGKVSRKKAR
jgi:hypothetical protein